MDVIIFAGQSNMQGQSERLVDFCVENCFEYKYLTDSLVPLCDPVGEFIKKDGSEGWGLHKDVPLKEELSQWLEEHAVGGTAYGCTSLVPAFCKAYKRPAVAVHCAKGSTVIAQWQKGQPCFEIMLKKAKSAIKKVQPQHIYFVWLQGESDAIAANSAEYYLEKLTLLKNDLKKELGIEKFGIIRVGRFTKDARDDKIIKAQDEACDKDRDFLMLTTVASDMHLVAEYMNKSVGGHYSAKGLMQLGTLAGKALFDAVQ